MHRRKKTSLKRRGSKHAARGTPSSSAPRHKDFQESIPEVLREVGRPLTLEELAERMRKTGAAAQAKLTDELDQLIQSGQLLRNRRDE